MNDPVLTRMAENTFWFALASSDALLFARGLKNAYPDLDVTIQEADVAPLQVQGPKSKRSWPSSWARDPRPAVLLLDGSEDRRRARRRDPDRMDVRGRLRGLPHRHLHGNEVYEAIMDAGEEFGIRPTGPSDIRRIEGAIFNWGADMTYEHNPLEMGLDRLVDWDLADERASRCAPSARSGSGGSREDQRRRDRRRAFPRTEQREVARRRRADTIGTVTSAIYSPRLTATSGSPGSRRNGRARATGGVETEWGVAPRRSSRCPSSTRTSRSPSLDRRRAREARLPPGRV